MVTLAIKHHDTYLHMECYIKNFNTYNIDAKKNQKTKWERIEKEDCVRSNSNYGSPGNSNTPNSLCSASPQIGAISEEYWETLSNIVKFNFIFFK